ncbi:MAG: acyl-ACP--UDP-N-acetylglucosamine O-acyltransferase [Gammaproteobacteria bacterium]|nr:acyl-ACP--UDP-N-acetylglucosamine O-acyltransferase [Gammaproteobacteria bacterium]MCB1861627.1 acyl-ACP--UDP-N-acetylglucosamine O-acyltransferase [Gammaproteobacteria bacterium]MCB1874037.1 acyl-ACP--UDP-N-acetylglucosamine O-acyltransferase [Gammaproteobacteria bacterium]MCB1902964.1 acyl-ACP--UDP-N-acetylglucosamine O-acyltransferase [Gammaproteobacteria bacterium]
MTKIHPTAIIDHHAEIHDSVEIGPFSIVERGARIGAGCRIESHVRIYSGTIIGCNNRICHGALLGCEPQDLTFTAANSKPLTIGDNNHFKEGVNISRGVKTDAGTIIGCGNYFMGNFHAGHDSIIGNNNVLGHASVLAGHVTIGDNAFISGLVAIHQFTYIGNRVMIAGCAKIVKDIPPFTIGDGNPARICGINSVGLRRAGFPPEVRMAIKLAYKRIYNSGENIHQALAALEEEPQTSEIVEVINFFKQSKRGVTAHR